MSMKIMKLACFFLAIVFVGLSCSKAPGPFPQTDNRIVLGEFFTTDM